jgi:hypothetical protein
MVPTAAPTNVNAAPGDGAVTLTWDPVAGADSYTMYWATQAGLTKSNYAGLPGGGKASGVTSPWRVTSLKNGTTYYFLVTATKGTQASVESAESAVVSAIPSPATLPGDPHPTTGAATSVAGSSATLNGTFTNPAGYTTSVWFEYGTSTAYGNTTPAASYLVAGAVSFAKAVIGLPPLTTIHFRLVAQNDGGTFQGNDATFRTLGEPTVLLSDLDAPTNLVSDASALYWLEVYSGRLRRFDLGSDTVSTIVPAVLGGNSASLAIDPSWLYFAGQTGSLHRVAHDGSSLDDAFSTLPGGINQIVAHSTGVYVREEWLEEKQPLLWVTHYFITRISLDGLTKTRLFERTGGGSSGFGGGMAVDDTNVYFADYYEGTVHKVPITGGSAVILATGLGSPGAFVLDGTDLYVACADGIKKIGVNTGVLTTAFADNTSGASMAKEGGILYLSGSGLSAVDLATGTATLLSVQPRGGGVPVITPSNIYWNTGGNHYYPPLGTLERISKPQ